jgi:hypothetical protein
MHDVSLWPLHRCIVNIEIGKPVASADSNDAIGITDITDITQH